MTKTNMTRSTLMFQIFLLLISFAITSCGGNGSDSASSSSTPTPSGTAIHDIQGSSDISPMLDQSVTFTAIVTGDFQHNDSDDSNTLDGFYVQQSNIDSNPLTSEGIFVFDGTMPLTDVQSGDQVQVSGTVKEYFGETQIKPTSVKVIGTGSINAVEINLPTKSTWLNSKGDEVADLEAYEGMLVKLPQKLLVSNLRFLERYGEVLLTQGELPQTFTNVNKPSITGYAEHRTQLAQRSIILDDGLKSSNPVDIKYLKAGNKSDFSIRVGDSVQNIVGNIRYSRGSGSRGDEGWRIEPVSEVIFIDDNPRPSAPEVLGNLRIASFNVLNFFTNIDNGQASCGASANQNCRGADSNLEFQRQLQKTVTALTMMTADIIGLIELENTASESINALVSAINASLGTNDFIFLDTGSINTDAIKTGFIYNQRTVRLKGNFALLTSSVDSRFNDNKNRPALAQSFELISNASIITIVLNHLKSKGSSCASLDDPNINDGQGNCNLTRKNAAAALTDWLSTDPTSSGDTDTLIIGDLNAYLREDPIQEITNAGYINLLDGHSNPYSYSFDGQLGTLDHAIASTTLAPQIIKTTEWHINAAEPNLLDYNLDYGRNENLFNGNIPYRSSDHDPMIIDLNLTN